MVFFSYFFIILTQSRAIRDSMFNFGNFLSKNGITFNLAEIERKKRYLVSIKICCASNVAIKNVKIARKKFELFSKHIFFKVQIFRKKQDIFSDSGGSSRHFDYLFICLGLILKL